MMQSCKKFSGTSFGLTPTDDSHSRRTLTFTIISLHRRVGTGANSTLKRQRNTGILTTPIQSLFSPIAQAGYFSNLVQSHGLMTMSGTWMTHSSSKVSILRSFSFPLFNILSGVCGELEGESIVGASIQGDLFTWCHVEPLSSHPGTVRPPNSGNRSVVTTSLTTRKSSTCVPVKEWNDALRQALDSPNIKIRIVKCTEPIRGCV